MFEVVGNEGRKKLREIFCRRPEKFYLGLQIEKVFAFLLYAPFKHNFEKGRKLGLLTI